VATIDLKRLFKDEYTARVGSPALVKVKPHPFLMIDGHGDPNTAPGYVNAVGALYPIAYAIRALVKCQTGDAHIVMPLEGLWWADDMDRLSPDRKGDWNWTMMIAVPGVVTAEDATRVIAETTEKKDLVAGGRVRFEVLEEGTSAQVMHAGPYSAEAPTIGLLHGFIADEGLTRRGLHHEIYLGDPRTTDPAKLKTIIRQPVSGPPD